MRPFSGEPLWAIHLLDGFLSGPATAAGFAGAGLLVGGAVLLDRMLARVRQRELSDAEVAYLGVLTSAFFVASLIHIPAGPLKVHLLLNGLLGVVLRWRAAPAIAVGLLLQAVLFGHGGVSALGMNICVMTLPALFAWWLFAALNRLPWLHAEWFRTVLVTLASCLWLLCLAYFLALIASNSILDLQTINPEPANRFVFHPVTVFLILLAGLQCAAWEPRLEHAPEFPVGLFVGIVTVLATLLLHSAALLLGGAENWNAFVLVNAVIHLPVAVIEGIVLGFIVGFLAKVKPDMLGLRGVAKPCVQPARSVPAAGQADVNGKAMVHSRFAPGHPEEAHEGTGA